MVAPADGSWDLTILITDIDVEKIIRTRGDLHVGGLMLRLVNAVGKSSAYYINRLGMSALHMNRARQFMKASEIK